MGEIFLLVLLYPNTMDTYTHNKIKTCIVLSKLYRKKEIKKYCEGNFLGASIPEYHGYLCTKQN